MTRSRARVARNRTQLGGVLAALSLLLVACSDGGVAETSSTGGADSNLSLTLAAQLDNNSFDVAQLEEGNRIQYWQPVYDTLIHLTPDNEPEPGLATEWSYNDAETVLTLTLREGVTFTDGEPFDAEAVAANLEYIKAGGGQSAPALASLEEVAVISPTEVELRLSAPDPALILNLGYGAGAMASPSTLGEESAATNPIGSGPYIYDASRSVAGSNYEYVRNEEYWEQESYPFDELTIRPMNDVTPRLNALRTGQVDGAFLSPQTAAEAESAGITLNTRPVNWAGLSLVDRAGEIVPELADVRVRQAINHAVDAEALVEQVLLGYGEVTSQPFTPDSAAYVPELDDAYPYDPERAAELIREAGAEGMTLTMPQGSGGIYDAAYPIMETQLEEVGINVEYDQVPADQFISEVRSGRYAAYFIPLGSKEAWRDVQTWFTPGAPWNPLGSESEDLNALLAEVPKAAPAERDEIYQEINRYVVEQAWLAPYFWPENIYGTSSNVTVTMQAGNAVPFISAYQPVG